MPTGRVIGLARSRAARRSRRRITHHSERLLAFRPSSPGWHGIGSIWQTWKDSCTAFFTSMVVCAVCGIAVFPDEDRFLKELPRPAALFSNPFMVSRMRPRQAGSTWYMCRACRDCEAHRQCKAEMQPVMAPGYIVQLLSTPEDQLQQLAVADITVNMCKQWRDFAHGTVQADLLFSHPLVQDTLPHRQSPLGQPVMDLLAFNVQHNPLVHHFKTLLERPNQTGYPTLDFQAIQHIVQEAAKRGPWCPLMPRSKDTDLSIVLHMDTSSLQLPPKQYPVLKVGELEPREGPLESSCVTSQNPLGHLLVDNNVLDSVQCAGAAVTAEAVMFPYLFPAGKGYFSNPPAKTFHPSDYFKLRATALFTPFSLHKTYLLVCYTLLRCYDIVKKCNTQALMRHLRRHKAKHPEATDQQVYKELVKFDIPGTVQGSPAYFRHKLADLLAIADTHGMPHLFVTLTADEVSDSRWAEIDGMEDILVSINRSLTYKNAPAECCKVFMSRFFRFLNQHLLQRRILGHILH